MNIVIVESPAKAKTVNKYLGSGYRVLASYGHVRDLPSKNGSVLPDKDFEMHWDVEPKAAKRLDEIAKAVKGASKLILATDPHPRRRALDYLAGSPLSPVRGRKLPGARSAGRVQSVALRLVCDRELEIEKFRAQEYWSILAELATAKNEPFQARLFAAEGTDLEKFDIPDQATAERL